MATDQQIVEYLHQHSQLVEQGYRAAVHLRDGTFLPRVYFVDYAVWTDHWLDFVQCARMSPDETRDWLSQFARVNRLDGEDIASLQPSTHAWPAWAIERLSDPVERQEYADFTLVMRNGEHFHYDIENAEDFAGIPLFIPPPEGRNFKDVVRVYRDAEEAHSKEVILYSEQPYFVCLVEGLAR